MTNEDRLKGAFMRAFDLPSTTRFEELKYQHLHAWDSVAHMMLIAELESEFDVMFSTEDVIALGSFTKARELLSKGGVDFGA